ncbi:CAP domain-containing protein [Hydrotalea sp.]|uniref:CAP domain-containing protein n=1 Tax=Hydrotalea sp. TaxID=2881279 RepID=UPI0026256C23|nr:CAP domain-containing protein [Hydrotalea sp.]
MHYTFLFKTVKLSMILLAFVGNGCIGSDTLHTGTTTKFAKMEKDVLYYINQHRAGIGLAPLQWDKTIYPEAVEHSVDMAKHRVAFGHDGFDARFNAIKSKLGYLRGGAENVALGHLDAKGVVDGWLHSPGHKKNIEGNYNLTAIGIAQSNDGNLYFTQIFINKPN